MATRLFDLLLTDMPFGFSRALLERMQFVYSEAFESVTHDPRFGEPEARYLHGHTRRALVESTLRELAHDFGIRTAMRRPDGVGGPEHVMLTSGRFCFTACHVMTPNSFPKDSRHRGQYSRINEHVAQGELFPAESAPGDADIYGIIFHCEAAGDKSRLGTLSIGFPNERCDEWIAEPLALIDLVDVQQRLHDRQEQKLAPPPAPQWKQHKGSGESGA